MDLSSKRIFKNASWIIGGKVVQSLLAFIIGIATARYLGPSNYGLINYASSVVAFVLPISLLGLNNTLVQEISQNPQSEGKILGTSIFMSAISAVFCMIGVVAFTAIANWGDEETIVIVAIYSLNLVFQVLDFIQYWFQSKLLSKYSAIVTLLTYLIISGYKLFLLITGKNVYWFAVSYAIDYFLVALFLLILYRKLGGQPFSVDLKIGIRMIAKSKYYIIAGLMTTICSQTDRIMLKSMMGEMEIGYYSAAVNIATIASFVFAAIIDSFRPVILSTRVDSEAFRLNLKRLYSIIIWISLLQGVVMSVFSDLFVNILYGEEFVGSSGALRVLAWFTTFSYLGSVRNIWILANNKQKYIWHINAVSAISSVLLNMILIPLCGALGAAITSVSTQFLSNFVLGFLMAPIRENNMLIIESLNPKIIFDLVKKR